MIEGPGGGHCHVVVRALTVVVDWPFQVLEEDEPSGCVVEVEVVASIGSSGSTGETGSAPLSFRLDFLCDVAVLPDSDPDSASPDS